MSKKDKSYYQIFGLAPDASGVEIKKSYRRLAKSFHPDLEYQHKSERERIEATEDMSIINLAYETLMDSEKRAKYDVLIGVTVTIKQYKFKASSEDEAREVFLAKIFHPSRQSIGKIISAYKKQIHELSQDPFDDELVAQFEEYLNDFENILRKASTGLSSKKSPVTLEAAVLMMRHAIAQSSDALDEMRRFCLNYNYDHLSTAESLLRIAHDLLRQSHALTKGAYR